MIRRAIGELVYDHLIAQKIKSSGSKGNKFTYFVFVQLYLLKSHIILLDGDDESSEVHLGRMLQILREFPDDPILSAYVIDDVWDDMKAMKVYS